jgi:hypothetical protein
MQEILEFVKFDPAPKGNIEYSDYKGYFQLLNPQFESVSAQGHGSGARYAPLYYTFNMGAVDAKEFADLVRNNQKTKVKGLHYVSTKVYDDTRQKRADIKYETLTIMNVTTAPNTGDDGVQVSVAIEWSKADGKITQYKANGKIDKSSPVKVDMTKGTYK